MSERGSQQGTKLLSNQAPTEHGTQSLVVPYDECLLERSRTQWQFGDWASLASIERTTLQHHPNRTKIALLVSSALMQGGKDREGMDLIRVARDWGASEKSIGQILIACAYNNLGKAAALAGDRDRAASYFEAAVSTGTPGTDVSLLTEARTRLQLRQLGIELDSTGRLQFGNLKRLDLTKQMAAQDDEHKQAEYLNRSGEDLYANGMYKLALEYFQRASDQEPDNAWYWQNMAEAAARIESPKGAYWESKQLRDAIGNGAKWSFVVRHYWQALKLDPATVETYRNQQRFKLVSRNSNQIESPVFIAGCGHSGTSIMLAIVGSHPNIMPIPKESALFLHTDEHAQVTMQDWDQQCAREGKTRWVEKTPPHIFQINRFLAFRPASKFIIMLRDGRDVVCSLKYRDGYSKFSDRLDRWTYENLAALPYWDHPQATVVRYEDLVAQPQDTLRRLMAFLGEEYSPRMLDYHKEERYWYSDKIRKPDRIETKADHLDNRNWQINRPLFDGRGRWKTEMSDSEKDLFKQSKAEQLLEEFGYVDDPDW